MSVPGDYRPTWEKPVHALNGEKVDRAARNANLAMYLGISITALFLFAAAVAGLQLEIRSWPTILTIVAVALLGWVRWRHAGPSGDERLATGAGVVLILFAGGLAGGLICLVGQTFALPFIDPLLHRGDLALGIDVESIVRGVVRIPGFPDLLTIAYNSSFPLVFGSALLFAGIGRSQRAWELCFVFNLCLLVTAISSALMPATGPFHYLHFPAKLQAALPPGAGIYYLDELFALRSAHRFIVDPTKLQGVAVFPSFHTMLALMTAATWRDFRKVRVPMCAWQGLVILSAIPIGGHYVVDLVAGAICCPLAYLLWRRLVSGPAVRQAAESSSVIGLT